MMMGHTPSVQKRFTRGQCLWRTFFFLNIGIILYFIYTIGLRICIEQPQQQQLQQQQQQQQQHQQQQQQELQTQQLLLQLQQQQQQIQSVQTMVQELLSQKESNTIITDFDSRLRSILKCHDRSYEPDILQRGDYWVLKNYVRAEHGELKCHESVTLTTHTDYTFLDNLIPVLQRFRAPVSIAMHAPGTDFQPTLDAISYLRDCLPESNLVRMYTTFHIYFINQHTPKNIPHHSAALKTPYNCTLPAPYLNVSSGQLYKTQKNLQYPINVARNIARDAALTHFILSSDIELYPSPGLVKKFLEMIARNDTYLNRKYPRVYPLPIFEAAANVSVPLNKTELQDYLRTGKAILFHKNICANCHKVPNFDEWVAAKETDELGVFHIGKRLGKFVSWEPIYIGTHAEPHYDYRLTWDGRGDKMPQGYALCALDYEFHILDNAFLVHRPGIKMPGLDAYRGKMTVKLTALINNVIYAEMKSLYGIRKECSIF